MRIAALFSLLALAACATPEEACIKRATKELVIIDRLIAETEENLARGYAIRQESEPALRLVLCTSPDEHFHFCTRSDTRTVKKPVAIDPASERRKLDALRRKRQEALMRARAGIRACKARYGGG